MSNTAIALTGASLDLALSNKERLNLLKDTVCTDLTMPEFEVFIEVCNRRRLDPFCRQIYAIKRKEADGSSRVVHQTGIDGFRLIAQRTGEYEGQLGPFWCGKDGVWKDVWLSDEPPCAAKVGILRKGFREPMWSVARFAAYVQTKILWGQAKGQIIGREPNAMWSKMGDGQLAKCAEALGLRRTFPEELSALYTSDEMAQAGSDPEPRKVAMTGTMVREPVTARDLDAELLALPELEAAIATMTTKPERDAVRARISSAGLSASTVAHLEQVWSARIAALKGPGSDPEVSTTAAAHRQAREEREKRERAGKGKSLPEGDIEYDEETGEVVPNPDDDGR